jgi:hypothetical protein
MSSFIIVIFCISLKSVKSRKAVCYSMFLPSLRAKQSNPPSSKLMKSRLLRRFAPRNDIPGFHQRQRIISKIVNPVELVPASIKQGTGIQQTLDAGSCPE